VHVPPTPDYPVVPALTEQPTRGENPNALKQSGAHNSVHQSITADQKGVCFIILGVFPALPTKVFYNIQELDD
jgi:hypothetical protein